VTVCIVDTSVPVELLGLPGFEENHQIRVEEFAERVDAKETFLLPLPVLLETGNHVAQIANGNYRRQSAEHFCAFVRPALAGNSPFVPTPSPEISEVTSWLDDFPDHAMQKVGLVDRSLIALFERQKALRRGPRRVYIWSLDHALLVHDTGAG
jgi:hypothetical protein